MSSPKSQSRRGDHTAPKASAPETRSWAMTGAELEQWRKERGAAPQPASPRPVSDKAAQKLQRPGWDADYEHEDDVERLKLQLEASQAALSDVMAELTEACAELERVKGQLATASLRRDELLAAAKEAYREMQRRLTFVPVTDELKAAIAAAEGRAP